MKTARRYVANPGHGALFIEVMLIEVEGHACMLHRYYGTGDRPAFVCSHEATGYVAGRGHSLVEAYCAARSNFIRWAHRLNEFLALIPGPINHVPGYVHPSAA